MTFEEALTAMKAGLAVRRSVWVPPRSWTIRRVAPVPGGPVDEPMYVRSSPAGRVPWIPTHADLDAEDWETA